MSERNKNSVHHQTVVTKLKEFDANVAQIFLPGWSLNTDNDTVTFDKENGEIITRLEVNLTNGDVFILEGEKGDDKDYISLAGISNTYEIKMHARFGNAWLTFTSSEKSLIFQPRNQAIVITRPTPQTPLILLR